MENQFIFNIVVGIAAFLGGWVLNNISKAIERIDEDLRDFPHMYVAKEDYRRDVAELKDICRQIFNKLDEKADK